MPFLFQYLIKFSLSLAVLYAFYFFVLRPLTFYQWNRFYLLCYSLLSFFIPFINITDWLSAKNINESSLINSIPAVDNFTLHSFRHSLEAKNLLLSLLSWNAAGWLFFTGALVMAVRLLYQYLSLRAMKNSAVLIKTGEFEFYDVSGQVSPFSFANSIFVNSRLHTEDEFHRILQHEFVHVKQKHTIDIMVAELICICNWFNPLAWLIRKAIRQNLEFIADKNVIEGGIEARQYQYLLLKVMGLPQYSITNNFSISSLKKRISMMNKMKTARVHLVKFLFVLPLLCIVLLAFRGRNDLRKTQMLHAAGLESDTLPHAPVPPVPDGAENLPVAPLPPAPPASAPAAPPKAAKVPAAPVPPPPPPASPKISSVKAIDKDKQVKAVVSEVVVNDKPVVVNVDPVKPVAAIDTINPAGVLIRVVNKKDAGEPLYVIDEKIQEKGGLQNLDPNEIEKINVLKGQSALALYGVKGKDGVIEVTTKKHAVDDSISISASKIYIKKVEDIKGLIIVDGMESSKEKLSAIDPASIKSVSVLKDGAATKTYGEKGKEGVIIITTK